MTWHREETFIIEAEFDFFGKRKCEVEVLTEFSQTGSFEIEAARILLRDCEIDLPPELVFEIKNQLEEKIRYECDRQIDDAVHELSTFSKDCA